jgi:hypothetical protein
MHQAKKYLDSSIPDAVMKIIVGKMAFGMNAMPEVEYIASRNEDWDAED